MIKVSDSKGMTTFVPPGIIERIVEAGPSSQWHGVRTYIKTIHGNTIECAETAEELRAAWELEMRE